MLWLIYGGSASGKSALAENYAKKYFLETDSKKLTYVATMKPYGEEAKKRIKRHHILRADKGFKTEEVYNNLHKYKADNNEVILLECMSNLVANELFDENNKNATEDIINAVEAITKKAKGLFIVTNNVFEDTMNYTKETLEYIRALGEINQRLGDMADRVTEVVCGIPINIK